MIMTRHIIIAAVYYRYWAF